MGSICHIYKKENWKILNSGKLKTDKNCEIVHISCGEWEDYGSQGCLSVWMKEDVYNKIVSNEYKIISQAYSEIPIKVLNEHGEEIDLI